MNRRLYGLLLVTGLVALVMACSSAALAEETTIAIHYSRFAPGNVTVPVGVPVTVTLHNQDPIEHEWIVGTLEVHERHRSGTEPYHDQAPTEVTVPALSTRTTTVKFDTPGEYAFICHLPGHEAYGMRGTLKVTGR